VDSQRKYVPQEDRAGYLDTLEPANGVSEGGPTFARFGSDSLPAGEKPAEGCRLHRFDLGAESSESAALESTQNLEIYPISFGAGPKRPSSNSSGLFELAQSGLDDSGGEGQGSGDLGGRKGPMSAGVPAHHVAQRVGHRLQEDKGHSGWRLHT
jgi:hypothetical protein